MSAMFLLKDMSQSLDGTMTLKLFSSLGEHNLGNGMRAAIMSCNSFCPLAEVTPHSV